MLVRPFFSRDRAKVGDLLVHMTHTDSVDHIVSNSSMTRMLAIAICEQTDCKGFLVEDGDGCVKAFIVSSRKTQNLLKKLQCEGMSEEKFDCLAKHEALAAFSGCARSLFFSKPLQSMFEIFFETLQEDIGATDFALIADKREDLVLNFLSGLKMQMTFDANSYVVMKKSVSR